MAARLALAAALLFALVARALNFTSPLGYGFDGWLGAMHGNAARHFARDGILGMRLLPYIVAGPAAPGDPGAQIHHPPLLHILNGLVWRGCEALLPLGASEWSLRLTPSLATLATVGLVFAIGRRMADERTGALAALLFAATPMVVNYGGLANYEPVVCLGTAAAWLLWLRWRESGRARDIAALAGVLVLAIWVDWFGAFAALPIAADALCGRPRAPLRVLALLGGASVAAVLVALLWYEAQLPGTVAGLAGHARYRAGSAASDAAGTGAFGAGAWCARVAGHVGKLFGAPLLSLAALGIAVAASLGGRLREAALRTAALGLVAAGATASFPQASFTHEFLPYPLALPLALGGGLLPSALCEAGARIDARRPTAGAGGRPRRLGLALLGLGALSVLAGAASGAREGLRLLAQWRDERSYRALGLRLGALTRFEGAVATPGTDHHTWDCAGFYADRAIDMEVATLEEIEARRRREALPGGRPPVRYVALTPTILERHGALAAALAARYPAVRDEGIVVFDLGER